jgi:spore coat polysaccharide biosynthesis predicted glycosyltransferase SpsG
VGGGAYGGFVTARALLVPDCGSGVGLGHLERMLALADALRRDLAAVVALPAGERGLHRRVADRGHDSIEESGDAAARATAAAGQLTPDVIVLDGYGFDLATQQELRRRAPLIVVDDLGHPAFCDLAVNPSPGGEDKRPSGADAYLGGARYALVPPGVVEARQTARRQGRGRRSVLVSTGATDALGIISRVVGDLLQRDPGVEVVAVVGPEMDRDDLPRHPHLNVLVEPSSLSGALATATVFTGAAGTSAVQAACAGVPAVITPVVANQRDQAAALAAAGCAVVVAPDELAVECLRLLDDPERRTEMARLGRELVDGRGAARVADSVRRLVRAPAA